MYNWKKGLLMTISLYVVLITTLLIKQAVFATSSHYLNRNSGQAVDNDQIKQKEIDAFHQEGIRKREKVLVLKTGVVNQHAQEDEVSHIEKRKEAVRKTKVITISAVGDVTIGSDEKFGYRHTLIEEIDKVEHHYLHFVEKVKPIFEQDDLTIANLETTLTNAKKKAVKKFRFKGKPDYVEILKEGSVEAVNIANNHTYDYLQQGFDDTVQTLENAGIGYFGYHYQPIETVKGIRIGLLGYEGWEATNKLKQQIKNDIKEMKQRTDLIIVSFHWGIERAHYPTPDQMDLGHYAVDQGADLVVGHHPHVLQGIEEYKGKYIVYSLGNFLFGGNKNPSDKDTMIFQQSFYFDQERNLLPIQQINLIPCAISSVSWRNNYQPVPLKGKEKERVLNRVQKYSSIFEQ